MGREVFLQGTVDDGGQDNHDTDRDHVDGVVALKRKPLGSLNTQCQTLRVGA